MEALVRCCHSSDAREAVQHRDGLQLTFEGFDHLDEEVKLLENSPFYHFFPHAEVAHAGYGEPPSCSPQLPDREEQTWGGREASPLGSRTEEPHRPEQNRGLDEEGSPQVFLLPSFPWIWGLRVSRFSVPHPCILSAPFAQSH